MTERRAIRCRAFSFGTAPTACHRATSRSRSLRSARTGPWRPRRIQRIDGGRWSPSARRTAGAWPSERPPRWMLSSSRRSASSGQRSSFRCCSVWPSCSRPIKPGRSSPQFAPATKHGHANRTDAPRSSVPSSSGRQAVAVARYLPRWQQNLLAAGFVAGGVALLALGQLVWACPAGLRRSLCHHKDPAPATPAPITWRLSRLLSRVR